MPESKPLVRELTPELLTEITRRLVAALAPRAVYVFGSRVYGTPHSDSDVDILVTVADETLAGDDQDERGYRCLRGLFLPIELHFFGHREFERRAQVVGSFEHEVRTRGKMLYAG